MAETYWKYAKKVIYQVTGFDLTQDPPSILFNDIRVNKKTERQFITDILLTTKYAIYKNGLDNLNAENNSHPSIPEVKRRLYKIYSETYYANICIEKNYQFWNTAFQKICIILGQKQMLKY